MGLTFRFAVFLALAIANVVAAKDSTMRSYQLPDKGYIQLVVPTSWRDELRQPPDRLPPTIVFTPNSGTSFQILLTPMFSIRQGMVLPDPQEMRASVERAAQHAKNQAVEKTLPVVEFVGTSGVGYYFSATDKAPKSGEYKYMTQGMFRLGDLASTFTVLTNDGGAEVVSDALSVFKSAVHVNSKAP